MGPTLVSYIIVSYKTREMTLKCLADVLADADEQVEVIVVDNASGDGTVEAVAERFPQVRVVASPENLGFGRGNNAGMAVARGELFILLNTDAFIKPGFTSAMRKYFEGHPDVGLFGPRVLNADGTLQVSCYPFPTPVRAWLENLWLPHGSYRKWGHDRERDVESVIGACMGVSARMVRQLGGFDHRFFMYAEEADWQVRIRQAGWRVTFTPSAVVTHLGGASGDDRESVNPHFFRSLDTYVLKHHGVLGQVSFRLAMVVGCTLRMVGWLLVGPFTGRAAVAGRKIRLHARLAWRQLTVWCLLIILTWPATSATETVWPNAISSANSDPWLMAHHQEIDQMRPRFLVVNFANGLGEGGEDNVRGGPLTPDQVRQKAQQFLDMLSAASTWQPRLHPAARPFLRPELVRVVNLQDENGHANSHFFPRGGVDPATGYPQVGYARLFSADYAPYWGFTDHGRALTLGEIVDRGLINEVIMMANQVDGRRPNSPDQVTNHILEVAMVAQAYDGNFQKLPGQYVKNGIAHDRQRTPSDQCTWHDDNSMPWVGRSLRIYFMNANRGPGCLLHSLGHEFEFRYNEAAVYAPGTPNDGHPVNPWLQPLFRRYADFDLKSRYHVPFDSLYAGGDHYSYHDGRLGYGQGEILNYVAGAGNVHYPPGATHGYDYHPASSVMSTIETFCKPGAGPEPWSAARFAYLTQNRSVDQDCGGDFLVYWFQNMPGRHNDCVDSQGRPMRNWWPFMYY